MARFAASCDIGLQTSRFFRPFRPISDNFRASAWIAFLGPNQSLRFAIDVGSFSAAWVVLHRLSL